MSFEVRRRWSHGAIAALAISLFIVGGAYLGVLADRSYLKMPENIVLKDFSVNVNELTNTITVSGTGRVSGSPDQAIVTFGVVTQAGTALEAMRLNAERVTRVVEALRGAGVSEDFIETVNFGVQPIYDHNKEVSSIVGYRVTNQMRVTIGDLDRVGEFIDLAGGAGANQIYGVTFTLSDEGAREMRDQALLEACEDAGSKARLIGDALGLTIKGVVYVSESAYYRPFQYDYAREVVGAQVPTPIYQGDVDVVVSVQVIYLFG
ncbi:MAG: SIMPL domain-containing protein [Candidatus Geothermarchaeales archaeon]